MRKVWMADELGRFFAIGPTDLFGKPSHFYSRICKKDVSVMTHGIQEILRHDQGTKHFHGISVFVWKLRVGVCLISKATSWERKKLSGSGSGSWELHKWWGIESIPFRETSWWIAQLQLTSVFPCFGWSTMFGRELRTGPSVLVSFHSKCWASERRCYVVTRWGVG